MNETNTMLSQWAKTKSAIWRTLLQGILSHTPLKFTCDLWRFFASRKSTLGMSSLSHEFNFICCFLSRTSNRYTTTCCCTILLKWFQMPTKIQVQEDHDDLLCIVIQCNSLPPRAAELLQTLEPNNIDLHLQTVSSSTFVSPLTKAESHKLCCCL